MSGKYTASPEWTSHPQWNPATRLTLRISLLANSQVEPTAAKHALNDWLETLRPAWLTLDGQPRLVAFDGAAFVELAPATDAAAICPDVLISATGDDAPEWIQQLTGEFQAEVEEVLPGLEFHFEELPPRPFGHL